MSCSTIFVVLFIHPCRMFQAFGLSALLLISSLLVIEVQGVGAIEQTRVAAKSAAEVKAIARSVTVEIKLQKAETVGSGVIIDRKGDLYTVVTNEHVICGNEYCSELPSGEIYSLALADGQQYQVRASNIRLLRNSLDLAIIQFRSNHNYAVAKVAALGSLKTDDNVYTAGFPFAEPGFTFGEGKAIAVVNERFIGDGRGYTIVYNAPTLPGMSGGGVFNSSGQLAAIHGQGDKFAKNTEIDNNFRVGSKLGINRGIPIRWLVKNLAELGINIGTDRSISSIRVARAKVPTTADECFIAGVNKFISPGSEVVAGKQQALQEFSKAIQLNPRYQHAYFMRAEIYMQLRKFQQSLSDYNQAIIIDPKFSDAYNNRGILKYLNLNDIPGALADFNQSIIVDSNFSSPYVGRAIIKADKLNDIPGALSDFNQAIQINPKDSNIYFNRAIVKTDKLNDIQGALADYNQAILINPKYSKAYYNRAVLKYAKLNDIQGALADYNQNILINPNDSEAYYNRALLKKNNLNDIQGALTDFNQAILINPKDYLAYYNRATLKTDSLEDTHGALTDFNQAITINPKFFNAYNNRALLKENKLNDIQGALTDFNQAIIINPKYSLAYSNRAILKIVKFNDVQGALSDFNQSIIIDSKDPTTYFNRAMLKENKLKDMQGALSDYNQAIIINPKYSVAYYNRAILKNNSLNDREGAIQDFRQATRLYREQGKTRGLQSALQALQDLGVGE
jgi:tetratricopeptide (TPR) repeat protein/S1-C subfamily serine protease